jgi:hypothetical protein
MNQSINYSGFSDMLLDSSDDYEPYGYADTNEGLENIYKEVQSCKAGINDLEYAYDD